MGLDLWLVCFCGFVVYVGLCYLVGFRFIDFIMVVCLGLGLTSLLVLRFSGS